MALAATGNTVVNKLSVILNIRYFIFLFGSCNSLFLVIFYNILAMIKCEPKCMDRIANSRCNKVLENTNKILFGIIFQLYIVYYNSVFVIKRNEKRFFISSIHK